MICNIRIKVKGIAPVIAKAFNAFAPLLDANEAATIMVIITDQMIFFRLDGFKLPFVDITLNTKQAESALVTRKKNININDNVMVMELSGSCDNKANSDMLGSLTATWPICFCM